MNTDINMVEKEFAEFGFITWETASKEQRELIAKKIEENIVKRFEYDNGNGSVLVCYKVTKYLAARLGMGRHGIVIPTYVTFVTDGEDPYHPEAYYWIDVVDKNFRLDEFHIVWRVFQDDVKKIGDR